MLNQRRERGRKARSPRIAPRCASSPTSACRPAPMACGASVSIADMRPRMTDSVQREPARLPRLKPVSGSGPSQEPMHIAVTVRCMTQRRRSERQLCL